MKDPLEIAVRLARLQFKFRENVVDSELAWSKLVLNEAPLAGMSEHAKTSARVKARANSMDGYLLTLDSPSYYAVMKGADDRALRHELYEAFTTRASDRGPRAGKFDNGPVIDEILALRHEQARLGGFPNYAESALQTSIVDSADDAERYLLELNAGLRPRAQAELEEVWAFAKARDGLKGFRPWDLPYYAEKLKGQGTFAVFVEIEWALFDLRVHRDYVPSERSSRLRSHVLDTLAQVRREVSLLQPPPWDRMASSFLDGFGPGANAITAPAANARASRSVVEAEASRAASERRRTADPPPECARSVLRH